MTRKITLEDLADQIDCLAKNVTRTTELLSKEPKAKTYIEGGYRA